MTTGPPLQPSVAPMSHLVTMFQAWSYNDNWSTIAAVSRTHVSSDHHTGMLEPSQEPLRAAGAVRHGADACASQLYGRHTAGERGLTFVCLLFI